MTKAIPDDAAAASERHPVFENPDFAKPAALILRQAAVCSLHNGLIKRLRGLQKRLTVYNRPCVKIDPSRLAPGKGRIGGYFNGRHRRAQRRSTAVVNKIS